MAPKLGQTEVHLQPCCRNQAWELVVQASRPPCVPLPHPWPPPVHHRHFPGELTKILEWFRDYKIPDGKPANKFGYDNKCMNKEFAHKVRGSQL